MHFFEDRYESTGSECNCCYSCIKRHASDGCKDCSQLISSFFPPVVSNKMRMSVANELKRGLNELFNAMNVTNLLVESALEVSVTSFIKDFMCMADEVKSEFDIVDLWNIDYNVASAVYNLFTEILGCDLDDSSTVSIDGIMSDSEEQDYELSDSSSNCD